MMNERKTPTRKPASMPRARLKLVLGLLGRGGRLVGQSRGAGRLVHSRGRGSGRLPVLGTGHEDRDDLHGSEEHHEGGHGTEQDQQLALRHGTSLNWYPEVRR